MGRHKAGEDAEIVQRRPGSPNWYQNFTVNGRRFRGSLGTDKKGKALTLAEEIRSAALKGEAGPAGPRQVTLDQACGKYWLDVGCHRAGHIDIQRRLATLLAMLGRGTMTDKVETAEIMDFVARRRGTLAHRKRTLLSPATINRELAQLRSVLRHANDVLKAPLGQIKWRVLFLTEPDERETILSPEEEDRLFQHLRPDYWPMVSFALLSGQRLSNVRQLRWRQIDWHRRIISFKVKSKRPGGRTHHIPLTDAMQAVLATERGRNEEFVFTYVCRETARYWSIGAQGKRVGVEREAGERYPFSQYGWRTSWRQALLAAGLENFRFHDLRHTAATRILAMSGGNIKIPQRLLGHAGIESTVRYLRANVDDVRAALEKSHRKDANTAKKRKARTLST